MITTPERRLPQRIPAAIAMSEVKTLGTIGGKRFVSIDGTEYQLFGPLEDPGHVVPQPGEIRVTDRVTRIIEGTRNTGPVTYRAFPARGAYQRLAETAARKAAASAARVRVRPVDVLSRLPLLSKTPERVLDLGGAAVDRDPLPLSLPAGTTLDPEATSALLRLGSKSKTLYQPPKPAPRGGAAIVAVLEARGYVLSITPSGRLLIQAKGGALGDPIIDTIRQAERLIVAALTGHLVMCELVPGCRTEAATIVAIDVAACEEHTAGGPDDPARAA